ncbi:hypothetical protein [Phenylobacterium sp. J367]|uniref:hypothetical protein n=1 Tax=Phenylobacterium sp. J367 TaxID=2898435 RepID=UPI0021510E23|nr:hypothetical protein [Phenylobacterium sp. J367]MCR5879774.1 hypothetical protein [Phenylobacterium sp. J367]
MCATPASSCPTARETPIAAKLILGTADDAVGEAHFDWREVGAEVWTITVETDAGRLALLDGGARLVLPETASAGRPAVALGGEYPRLYARFAELIRARATEADLRPLELVADAFLRSRRITAGDLQ